MTNPKLANLIEDRMIDMITTALSGGFSNVEVASAIAEYLETYGRWKFDTLLEMVKENG